MRTRGRKNSIESSVVVPLRPRPAPTWLTPAQAAIWLEVVRTEDPSLFAAGAMQQTLGDYCRHREAADRINDLVTKLFAQKSVARAHPVALGRLQLFLRMRDSETRACANLATKLRLTNQSRL